MSIRVSIYDFFAYTVPGGVILAIALYITQKYQVFVFNFANVSTLELIGLGIVAYLIGFVIDPVAKGLWYSLFCPKNLRQVTLNDFNKRHRDLEIPFQRADWYVSFAYIKRHSAEMVEELEHLKVTNIMLRNSSFGLVLFGLVFLIEFISHNFELIYLLAGIVCLTMAVILVKQAVKFNQWFYEGIFQSLVALISEPKLASLRAEKKLRVRAK